MDITYKTTKIKKILTNLYDLFHIPLFFLGTDGSSLTGTPLHKNYFCYNTEHVPELHKKCVACDKKILECIKKSRKPEWHLCHAGLFDAMVPVTKNGVTAGYILLGHIRTDNSSFSLAPKYDYMQKNFQACPYYSLKDLESLTFLLSNINFDNYIHIDSDKNFEERVMTYINDNLYQHINVKKICEEFHISRCYFYKIWKNNSDENLSAHITKKRVNKAKKMLRETDLPIYKIAESVGFKSYGMFCKAFQNQIGLSPSHYRAKSNQTEQAR